MQIQKTLALLVGTLIAAAPITHAQKITVQSGDLRFLKGETTLNVEYQYDGMAVGKFAREQDYVDKKVTEYNQKEAGKGDQWKAAWTGNRKTSYQPKFEALINKQLSDRKKNLTVGENKAAKYTLVFKTTLTQPGWNAAFMRAPALINAEVIFVETQNRNKQLAVITLLKSPGRDAMGFDFDVGYRLQEAYAKAGKELGALLAKKALK